VGEQVFACQAPAPGYDAAVTPPVRYRCRSCGNLTRFDVVRTTRTRSFHHYSTGGELAVEETEILDDAVESVTCRWCGPVGQVDELPADDGP
jgi:hypothetical protein